VLERFWRGRNVFEISPAGTSRAHGWSGHNTPATLHNNMYQYLAEAGGSKMMHKHGCLLVIAGMKKAVVLGFL
jgi:hypothetical protein